jgi:hypothetical protein
VTQHDDNQAGGPPPPSILVTIDDAHTALERLSDGTTVADLLRQIITTGRDARVYLEQPEPRPMLAQFATVEQLTAAINSGDLRLGLAAVTMPARGPRLDLAGGADVPPLVSDATIAEVTDMEARDRAAGGSPWEVADHPDHDLPGGWHRGQMGGAGPSWPCPDYRDAAATLRSEKP